MNVRTPKAGQFVPFLKHASAAVCDIPSVLTLGTTLGSVYYSDSFIDSSLTVSHSGLYVYAITEVWPGFFKCLLFYYTFSPKKVKNYAYLWSTMCIATHFHGV